MNLYRKTILPNGIKVISEKIPHVRSFSLGFWFNVGSRDESQHNNGITHFIEHMLFKGTTKRSAKRIASEVEAYGGYLNAFTSKEHTCYYGRGLSQHLERTFDVIADMIQDPLLKPREIKKEARVVVDELKDIEDNPEELIFDKFEELLYSGNSLSLPIVGSEEKVLGFSQRDLFNFIKEKYGFNRMIIAASGALEHEEILRLTDKYFKKNLGISSIRRRQVNLNGSFQQEEVIEKEIQQVHLILGKAAYGYKDKNRTALRVLSRILGEGSSSRLFQAIREKNGIAYQVNSFLNSFYDVSSFGVYLSTNEKKADKANELILREFRRLREKKISQTELKKAKEALKGNLVLSLENTSNRMIKMAQSELYFNRVKSTEEIIKNIDGVTSEEIIEQANKLLRDDSFLRIIIKSKKSSLKSAA